MNVLVNGKETGKHASVIVALDAMQASPEAIRAAERLISQLSGSRPFQWRDGTGTVTMGDVSTLEEAFAPPTDGYWRTRVETVYDYYDRDGAFVRTENVPPAGWEVTPAVIEPVITPQLILAALREAVTVVGRDQVLVLHLNADISPSAAEDFGRKAQKAGQEAGIRVMVAVADAIAVADAETPAVPSSRDPEGQG